MVSATGGGAGGTIRSGVMTGTSCTGVIWADDAVHEQIASIARDRAGRDRRTWADVARETRAIYAEVGVHGEADA